MFFICFLPFRRGSNDLTWGVAIEAIVGAAIFGAVLGGLIGKCVSDPEVSQLNGLKR
ncbi:hypothetical protein [Wolbachia endosymbiont (group E) of Neria commutata]|uniref:hypothetical protein n=1 Tax=Wolbachia endosymbiont (group E) of Neria commutata TaxID=3066149 RepID=UPI003132BC35